MGKKKTKTSADHVRNKRKSGEKKTNPFEVKINRQKHEILGRKRTKYDQGMPGVSRSKANKKRKETLLKEYQSQFKKNRFIDKRFGENDTSLSLEEKMMKRYALERSKTTGKHKFSLNEDEELTHYGQSLADIEKFDEPVISDEEENDDDKRAAAKIVAEEHFGGFMQRKKPEDEKKTWKERMEDVIKESKKKKHERQAEKEETVQMTVELDEQWRALHSLVSKGNIKGGADTETKAAADDYDMAVRSLQFEMKGQATDRLKSEEELARDEKERLEKLEADRIRRMKGLTEDDVTVKSTHKSADDLDDGFALEALDFDYVSYKDGQMNKEMEYEDNNDNDDDNPDDNDGDDDVVEDDDDDDEDDDNDDENGDDDDDGIVEDDEEEFENDNGSDEAEDNFSDLESDAEEEDPETKTADSSTLTKVSEKKVKIADDKEKQAMIEQAKTELPYTFTAPQSYDDLLDILEGHSLENQLTIIERIRKCHHPSLAEGNKQKLEILFSHLVQFYCELCIQDPPQLDYVDRMVRHLYELAQMSPENAATAVTSNLADRHEEFSEICQKKAGRGLYPGLDTLMLFKLVSILFPTSDFRHQVTTPSLMFMCEILACSPVNNGRDIAAGLLLCNLCLEYVTISKRYIPEVLNFLHGLLFLAADKDDKKIETVYPPFKPVGKNINLLHVTKCIKSDVSTTWSLCEILPPVVDEQLYTTDNFRVASINQCIKLLREFQQLYNETATFKDIFSSIVHMCEKLPKKKYPDSIQASLNMFVCSCKRIFSQPRQPLVMQKKKPKPLKMFEPKVEEKFDGRKKGLRGTKDFVEKQKLMHKYKKEMKGAVRELKKDTRFLARQQLKESMEKDFERKRKVKEIMGGLAKQEGDYKKMKLGKMPDS